MGCTMEFPRKKNFSLIKIYVILIAGISVLSLALLRCIYLQMHDPSDIAGWLAICIGLAFVILLVLAIPRAAVHVPKGMLVTVKGVFPVNSLSGTILKRETDGAFSKDQDDAYLLDAYGSRICLKLKIDDNGDCHYAVPSLEDAFSLPASSLPIYTDDNGACHYAVPVPFSLPASCLPIYSFCEALEISKQNFPNEISFAATKKLMESFLQDSAQGSLKGSEHSV